MKQMTANFKKKLYSKSVEQKVPYMLRNRDNISVPLVRTNLLKSSLIYSTINHWNDINPGVRNSKTMPSF